MLNIEKYTNGEELFDGQYKLLRRLSEAGGTADVWLALAVKTIDTLGNYSEEEDECVPNEESGMKVAIKIYRLQNILDVEGEQRFRDEFKIVYNCHHANLLPPSHFSIFEDAPYLVMPFCKDGSSEKLIGKRIDHELLWKYIHDVASGLSYLHSCTPSIIHQDIKPANVLIDSNGNFAITDFGISTKKENGANIYYEDANSGTLVYMPPERFHENPTPQPESDIWALGATLYEIVTGDVPFGNDGGLAQENGAAIPIIKQDIPKEIKKLIYSCLDKDPAKRPSAQEIVDIITERRLKRFKTRYLPLLAIPLLAIILFFLFIYTSRVNTFVELCNSGDSIITSIKEDIINCEFKIDDDSRTRIVQAEALYDKALTIRHNDAEKKEIVTHKVHQLDDIIDLYARHKELSDTMSLIINYEMPVQFLIYEEKINDISSVITKRIEEL